MINATSTKCTMDQELKTELLADTAMHAANSKQCILNKG